jgi:hypothetical protein
MTVSYGAQTRSSVLDPERRLGDVVKVLPPGEVDAALRALRSGFEP